MKIYIETEMKEMPKGCAECKQGYYRLFKDWLEDYEYEVIGTIYDTEGEE